MRPRIVIRAFTLRRDLGWAITTKKILEARGADVFIACSRNFLLMLKFWKPHAIVINTVGQVANCIKWAPESKIIHWPAEGGEPWVHCDANLLSQQPQLFNALAAVLAWGDGSLAQYEKAFGIKHKDKVFKFGNPRLDLIRYMPARSSDVIKSIGFATRFNSICHFDGRPTLYTLTRDINRTSVIGQVNGLVTTINLMKLVLQQTKAKISIRPHPLEAPEYYERYIRSIDPERISVDVGFDFSIWAKSQSFIVTPGSSAFLEAYLLGKAVISIDLLAGGQAYLEDFNSHSAFLDYRNAHAPQTEDEFMALVSQGLEGVLAPAEAQDGMSTFLADFHNWPRDSSAINGGAEKVIEIALHNKGVPRVWPTRSLLEAKDYLTFLQAIRKQPLHVNINYHQRYHKTPSIYNEIARNMLRERPTI